MKLWSLFYEIENDFSHYSSSYYFCFYFENGAYCFIDVRLVVGTGFS